MQKMNSFGSRLTGTKGQNAYTAWLKDEIAKMGYGVVDKQYTFKKWEATDWSLTVDGQNIDVSSPFPYSGLTDEKGVTGKLVTVFNNPLDFQRARGKIAVCRIKNLSKISSKIAFNKRASVPENLEIEKSYRGPVSTSFVKNAALVLGGETVGYERYDLHLGRYVRRNGRRTGSQLHLGISRRTHALGERNKRQKVLAAAKNKKSATLRLVGNIDDNAKTESFHAILKGTGDTNEAIIINTHTDGCNFSEENGGIGLLPMMKYFKAHPTKRTLIFVFVTGHFRLPVFREGIMTSNQATGRWLAENRNLWNGKTYKAVAGVSVEHLGCTEWKDVNGVYTKTNDIDTELVYTGNKKTLIRFITRR
ncbi:MAG: hypothetical protein L6V85_09525 [Clostridiales bacterium]|nr:MAG: hypothetical protein L6V85_09525 [Clostridiales bacterium]